MTDTELTERLRAIAKRRVIVGGTQRKEDSHLEAVGYSGQDMGSRLTADEIELGRAMDVWQRKHNRYPTWRDVLDVAAGLGYRKVAP